MYVGTRILERMFSNILPRSKMRENLVSPMSAARKRVNHGEGLLVASGGYGGATGGRGRDVSGGCLIFAQV